MKKRILMIVVVIIMLLMLAAPVSAVVKPPVTVKDALLKGIWGAIMDLQKQIDALTQRVDTIENSPMPEYRAGSYTTPPPDPEEPGVFWGYETQTVTFSHPMPDTNYRVSVIYADTRQISEGRNDYHMNFLVDSKTTTGFTFKWREANGVALPIGNNRKFDYIAIADN